MAFRPLVAGLNFPSTRNGDDVTYDTDHTCWNKPPEQCTYVEDGNVYYHPEIWGWTGFASLDLIAQYYEFHILAVLKRKDGTLVYAVSAGCSCPTPFDEYSTPESWTPITGITAFSGAVKAHQADSAYYDFSAFQAKFSELLERLSMAGVPA